MAPEAVTLCDAVYLTLSQQPTLERFIMDKEQPPKGVFKKAVKRAMGSGRLDLPEVSPRVAQYTEQYGPSTPYVSGLTTYKAAVALVALQAAPCATTTWSGEGYSRRCMVCPHTDPMNVIHEEGTALGALPIR